MHDGFCMWPQLEVFFSLEPRRGHCGCSCNAGELKVSAGSGGIIFTAYE